MMIENLAMQYLTGQLVVSYRTINRFRVAAGMEELIRDLFIDLNLRLKLEELVTLDCLFIDGTKIEANANKYSFVWKKATDKFSVKLQEQIQVYFQEEITPLIHQAIALDEKESITSEQLTEFAQVLEEELAKLSQDIEETPVKGKDERKTQRRKLKKVLRKVKEDFSVCAKKYESYQETFDGRNSFSKTDPDATFMRMKEDYMKNGQLKPGYNVQIATEGQYSLAYDLFPNPTDTRTLKPFLDVIESSYFALPEYIVADAGYGSEENYVDIIENRQLTPLITYGMYLKEQERRYKKDAFKTANWDYETVDDYYTCPNGKRLIFKYNSQRKDKNGFVRNFRVYECEDCCNCPYRSQCCKAKEGNNRKISINVKWEQQKEYIRAQLSDKKTGKIYKRRKIDVEPVFGFLKANLRFNRFTVRGKFKAKIEMGLALMAVNLRKYMQHTAAV